VASRGESHTFLKERFLKELVRELFDFNQEIGNFVRIKKTSGTKGQKGAVAGIVQKNGRRYIKINGKSYLAHRLVWLWYYGEWPEGQIDHKDGNPDNNRIENLRIAKNQVEQQQNQKIRKDNISGHPGVSWFKTRNKWVAYINLNKKRIHLGYFDSYEDACVSHAHGKVKYHSFQPTLRDGAQDVQGD
jgi:hypothetical protein